MGVKSVLAQFKEGNWPLEVIEFEVSTATVTLAAEALGVEPGRIAKTMALRLKDKDILILAKGDVKLDNKKFKAFFGSKARFIKSDEVEAVTGHPIGGVCPFGLAQKMEIYLDESLKIYDVVYPAGGTPASAVKIDLDTLEKVTDARWTDVCKQID